MKYDSQHGLFASLALSCSSAPFYAKIPQISFWRSFLFLIFYSFLGAVVLTLFISYRLFTLGSPMQDLLNTYDSVIPAFEGAYSDGRLEMDPSQFDFFLGIDADSKPYIANKPKTDPLLAYQIKIDTLETTQNSEKPSFGAVFLRDGLLVNSGLGVQQVDYAELGLAGDLLFDKESLRLSITKTLPDLIKSSKNILLYAGPLLLTFYLLVSALIQAVLFSFFGMLSLLIRGAEFVYLDLIKLSFYAGFPALLVLISTLFLGSPISWLPILIHIIFYYIGLYQLILKKV